ncbi:MAG: response regulator [Vallitaleaceae bacterium]|jgi:two-component system response regulator HupR/HoxA|nr:response regulator [Vallitaleaceae bacterium]
MEKTYSVLFVDDEINVLNSLKRGLFDETYNCIFASSGKEALLLLEKQEIAVIVSDMRMPEMNGLQLLKTVKEKYPDIVCIVLSGYTQLQQILATINQVDIFKFITKPWKLEDEFKVIINQAVAYYQMAE